MQWSGGSLVIASFCRERGGGGCRWLGCGGMCGGMWMVERMVMIVLLLEKGSEREGWRGGWSLRRRLG